jgi:hypothetical protein
VLEDRTTYRILVVTDHADATPALVDEMRRRASSGEVQFRLVVLNPARAELHLLHPERHDKAAAAERLLHETRPALEAAVGGRVIGSVSVRHDPMDAVEETVFSEPVDEIVLAVPGHHVSSWLHQDLKHRLGHLGIPITVVAPTATSS